jgi:hypothetical protein
VHEFLPAQVFKNGLLHRQDPQMRLHMQIITAKSTSPLPLPLTCLFSTRAANSLSRAWTLSLLHQVSEDTKKR